MCLCVCARVRMCVCGLVVTLRDRVQIRSNRTPPDLVLRVSPVATRAVCKVCAGARAICECVSEFAPRARRSRGARPSRRSTYATASSRCEPACAIAFPCAPVRVRLHFPLCLCRTTWEWSSRLSYRATACCARWTWTSTSSGCVRVGQCDVMRWDVWVDLNFNQIGCACMGQHGVM